MARDRSVGPPSLPLTIPYVFSTCFTHQRGVTLRQQVGSEHRHLLVIARATASWPVTTSLFAKRRHGLRRWMGIGRLSGRPACTRSVCPDPGRTTDLIPRHPRAQSTLYIHGGIHAGKVLDRDPRQQPRRAMVAQLLGGMGTAASYGVVHDTVEQHVDLLREQVSSVDETLMVGPGLSHDGSVSSANASPQDSPPSAPTLLRDDCNTTRAAAITSPHHNHQEARMTTSAVTPAHIEVSPGELAHISGAVIVGDSGGHVRITGSVEPSNVLRGMFLVETEVGLLYLDADLPVTIVNPELPDDADVVDLAQAVGLLRAS
ncbi:hypothetical protein QNA28_22655 [Rhodococcus rhodochrous]|nr:hypothetical protein [Rhodococcus rhodochrous]